LVLVAVLALPFLAGLLPLAAAGLPLPLAFAAAGLAQFVSCLVPVVTVRALAAWLRASRAAPGRGPSEGTGPFILAPPRGPAMTSPDIAIGYGGRWRTWRGR